MRRGVLIALLFLFCITAVAQNNNAQDYVEQILSSELIEGGNDEEGIRILLEELLGNPIKINRVSKDELERLPFLSRFQIDAIINYRELYGDILSANELMLLSGFSEEFVNKIYPFFSFEDSQKFRSWRFKEIIRAGRWQFLGRGKSIIERRLGYSTVSRTEIEKKPNCRYLSFPGTFYGQIKFNSDDFITSCITLERDAGEIGVDYLSGNLQIRPNAMVSNIVFGNYSAKFGQGLVLWNSPVFDGATDPRSLKKMGGVISPYNSTDENLALMGVAGQFKFGNFDLSAMASYRGVDATLKGGGFSSILNTGLHNTVSTKEKKHALNTTMAALNGSYSNSVLKLGCTALAYSFSMPYTGKNDELKTRCNRANSILWNISADGYFIYRKMRFFSEIAMDSRLNIALIAGTLFPLSDRSDIGVRYRYYPDSYYSYYAMNGLRVSDNKSNQCVTIRGKSYIGQKSNLGYSVEWKGKSYRGSLKFESDRGDWRYYLRVSGSTKKGVATINIGYNIRSRLNFFSRVDLSGADNKNLFYLGYHISQEFLYIDPSYKFRASVRLAWFDTPVWGCAIYAYERDILYGFAIPALYGKGLRYYANMRWDMKKYLSLWLKVSQTKYFDRSEVGSALEKISSSHKSEVKFEFRVRF